MGFWHQSAWPVPAKTLDGSNVQMQNSFANANVDVDSKYSCHMRAVMLAFYSVSEVELTFIATDMRSFFISSTF